MERYEHNLLRAAAEIHMHCTGSSNCLPDELDKLAEFVMMRLKTWTLSPPFTERYDEAVRELCIAAVRDLQDYRLLREKRATDES